MQSYLHVCEREKLLHRFRRSVGGGEKSSLNDDEEPGPVPYKLGGLSLCKEEDPGASRLDAHLLSACSFSLVELWRKCVLAMAANATQRKRTEF